MSVNKPVAGKPAQPAPIWMAEKVHQRSVTSLKPYARNNRVHTAQNVAKLAESIATFGFVAPILTARNGEIIAGHGRLEAARRLGLETVPTVIADHLSEAEIRVIRIADNKLAALSDWNQEALQIEFAELMDLSLAGELDFDLEITGFETPEIDIIIGGAGPDDPVETVEEPDPAKPVVTQPGDLWVLGQHRILCGNSLEAQSYETLLAGEAAAMVFTDPPYNVPIDGHVCGHWARCGTASSPWPRARCRTAEFTAFLARALAASWRRLRRTAPSPSSAWTGATCARCSRPAKRRLRELKNLCVWNKTNGGMGSFYRSKHELVFVFKMGTARRTSTTSGSARHGRYRTNVWDYAGVNSFGAGRADELAMHPTVKPVALVADAIRDVSRRGDIVLDVFGGSGTTLIAAEKTGRRARLIELDPAYVDVAIRRWQALTGQDAVLSRTGETFVEREASANMKEADHVEA